MQAGVFLMKLPVFPAEAGVLLFQGSDTLHRCKELFLQPGYTLGQPVMFGIAPRFRQLHKVGKYA